MTPPRLIVTDVSGQERMNEEIDVDRLGDEEYALTVLSRLEQAVADACRPSPVLVFLPSHELTA